MKFLVVAFCLALATTTAFDLRPSKLADLGGRIAKGQDAVPGQFPYQVGLSLGSSPVSTSWCGGSLIGANWVLTAAHCTEGIKRVTVYLGSTVRTKASVTFTVRQNDIIIHPAWNPEKVRNDISLIRIPTVEFTDLIQPIELPSITHSFDGSTGDNVIASGWGYLGDSEEAIAQNLQWGTLQIADYQVCARNYGYGIVIYSNICVSTSLGSSTCRGDSGGPLVLESTNVQIGLTSFGSAAGCEKGLPVAFTRLTSYLKWIEDITGISY